MKILNVVLTMLLSFLPWIGMFLSIPNSMAQSMAQADGPEAAYSGVCQTSGQNLCITPSNEIVMSLLGCATGVANGFPNFLINVPPGLDLEFNLTRDPLSVYESFFLVNLEVFNTPPDQLDLCTETDPGIYTPPLGIEGFDQPTFTRYVVPSAVVDQMAAESLATGYLLMIVKDCDGFLDSAVSFTITRNSGESELDLRPSVVPAQASTFATVTYDLEVENLTSENIDNLFIQVGENFGLLEVDEIAIMDQVGNTVTHHPDTLPFSFFSSIGTGEVHTIRVTARLNAVGTHSLFMQVLGDRCDDLDRVNFGSKATPSPSRINQMGMARTGDALETELILSNPGGGPLEAVVSGTNEDGLAFSVASLAGPPAFIEDTNRIQLAPGQSKTIRFSGPGNDLNRFLLHISSEKDFDAVVRQQRRKVGRAGAIQKGTTMAMVAADRVGQVGGSGVIPYKVLDPENKQIVVTNLNQETSSLTINLRNMISGSIIWRFTGLTVDSLNVRSFPLATGLDEDAYIEIDGDTGVVTQLEQNSADDFNLFRMRPNPEGSARSAVGPVAAPEDFAQPFTQVDPNNIDYGTSFYHLFIFPLTDQGIAPGSIQFSFDENCGATASGAYQVSTPIAGPNIGIRNNLNLNSDLRGGFAFFDDPDTVTSFRWIEDGDTFIMQAVTPVTKGRLYLPRVLLDGQVMPTLAPFRVQVLSDTAVTLNCGKVAADGTFVGFTDIALPAGAHQLCDVDFGVDEAVTYLEIEIPEGQPSAFWFNAFADEPALGYKDQLPLLPIQGNTMRTRIDMAIASWGLNGGLDCLGEMPDVIDLVNFVNNNYMCPSTP